VRKAWQTAARRLAKPAGRRYAFPALSVRTGAFWEGEALGGAPGNHAPNVLNVDYGDHAGKREEGEGGA
jgi:hypothetical protein